MGVKILPILYILLALATDPRSPPDLILLPGLLL